MKGATILKPWPTLMLSVSLMIWFIASSALPQPKTVNDPMLTRLKSNETGLRQAARQPLKPTRVQTQTQSGNLLLNQPYQVYLPLIVGVGQTEQSSSDEALLDEASPDEALLNEVYLPLILGAGQTGQTSPSAEPVLTRLQANEGADIYVNGKETEDGNGSSWEQAFTTLQDALSAAREGDEIWVAKGVYYPDEGGGQSNNDPNASFNMKNGVAIYGGFDGTETQREQRDYTTNVTVLSGDIDQNDSTDGEGVVTDTTNIVGNNAYQVIYNININSTAILDGFTINAGKMTANNIFCVSSCGAGMYNHNSSPSLSNLIIRGNSVYRQGGGMFNAKGSNTRLNNVVFIGNTSSNHAAGMFNVESDPSLNKVSFINNAAGSSGAGIYNGTDSATSLNKVSFIGNSAGNSGGGMFIGRSSANMNNVIFSGNSAGRWGGGVYVARASASLNNVTVSGNFASDFGGGMYLSRNSNPQISNSIFWNNRDSTGINVSAQIMNISASTPIISYTLVQGSGGSSNWDSRLGTDGGNNLDGDPRFVTPIAPSQAPTTAGDYRLQSGSPAIDAGLDAADNLETDLDGHSRIQGEAVDLGPYEWQPSKIWQPLSPSTSPASRGEHASAYHKTRQQIILYGGNALGWPYESQTWAFTGTTWTEITTAQRPSARYGAAMAFDETGDRLILFGGSTADDTALDETWAFDGLTWTALAPSTRPPSRSYHTLVSDGAGKLYLFGGNDGQTHYNDLWRFENGDWTALSLTGPAPSSRTLAALAYNLDQRPTPGVGALLLFGGRDAAGSLLSDLWTFNLSTNTWTALAGAGPSARQAAGMAYDPTTDSFILTGGMTEGGETLSAETWHFDQQTGWQQATTEQAITPRAYSPLVYDVQRDRFVLLGPDGTWLYQ